MPYPGVGHELSASQWSEVMSMPVKNVGTHKSVMLPKTRAMLEEFYRPFNQKLAKQLKDERYLWKAEAEEAGKGRAAGATASAARVAYQWHM